jgi:hypothetical protein
MLGWCIDTPDCLTPPRKEPDFSEPGVASEYARGASKAFAVLLIGLDGSQPPSDAALKAGWPHLSQGAKDDLLQHFLGAKTRRAVCDACGPQEGGRTLGASPAAYAPAASPNDWRKCPEGLVYRGAVRKHVEDLGIDDDDIGAPSVTGGGCAADSSREVVLRPQRVAIHRGGAASSPSLHIPSALVGSPAWLK